MKTKLVSVGAASLCAALLAGCGLAEVGASAATQGASAAEQAKQAKKTEEQVEQRVDDLDHARPTNIGVAGDERGRFRSMAAAQVGASNGSRLMHYLFSHRTSVLRHSAV